MHLSYIADSSGNEVCNMERRDHVINVARDFTRSPGGRLPRNGPFSGQVFRESLLAPALAKVPDEYERVIVDLDGVDTYIGSFLEEAFGGLLRNHGYTLDRLNRSLDIRGSGEFEFFRELALRYMREESARSRNS